ncbi:MAG: hypothetical protein HYY00_06070 [Chloroflexi bacterium]|nr:hypothetical protein [Chloroflexota bacterium]
MFTRRVIRVAILVALTTALLASLGTVQAQEEKPPALEGTIVFRDAKALSDSLAIDLVDVPAPAAGTQYEGWLLEGATKLSIGELQRQVVQGGIVFTYVEPASGNLAAKYSGFQITIKPSGDVAYSDTIPAAGMAHVRHLLSAWDTNPDKKGIAVGLRQQTALAMTHAQLAAKATTLADVKQHAEHVVNIIEGSKGANFGDKDGNGTVENPGDGRGVLGYADDAIAHAGLTAKAVPDRALIVGNSKRVIDSATNVKDWAGGARDNALLAIQQTNLSLATIFISNAAQSLTWAATGRDADGSGVIDGIPGEGGAQTAYTSAQDMGSFSLKKGKEGLPTTPVTGDLAVPQLALYALLAGAALTTLGLLMLRRRRVA